MKISGYMLVNKKFEPKYPWFATVQFSELIAKQEVLRSANCMMMLPCTITYEFPRKKRARQ